MPTFDEDRKRRLAELIDKRQRFSNEGFRQQQQAMEEQKRLLEKLGQPEKKGFFDRVLDLGQMAAPIAGLALGGPGGMMAGSAISGGLGALRGQGAQNPYAQLALMQMAQRGMNQPLQPQGMRLNNFTGRFM